MNEQRRLYQNLKTLSVFLNLREDPIWNCFESALSLVAQNPDEEIETCIQRYSKFVGVLYQHTDNWTEYLTNLVLSCETPCVQYVARGERIPHQIERAVRYELQLLSEIAILTPSAMLDGIQVGSMHLPLWQVQDVDLEKLYFLRLSQIAQYGYGVFARYHMFRIKKGDELELDPIVTPDPIALSDLIGYSLQREEIIRNTKALLKGKKASNVLLYGDAGTGKSASVKAVANAYADQGLRLIELGKEDLYLLPQLLDLLGNNPLKFILFLDDLSFQERDDDFSSLKAVLEGSVSARSHNTVIYATSNLRHIVRETFSARDGDEIHCRDTMQESISLSERFGIKVYYEIPKKDLYLEIVYDLAERYALDISKDELQLGAERFALRKSGRSPRVAHQYIEQLAAQAQEEE